MVMSERDIMVLSKYYLESYNARIANQAYGIVERIVDYVCTTHFGFHYYRHRDIVRPIIIERVLLIRLSKNKKHNLYSLIYITIKRTFINYLRDNKMDYVCCGSGVDMVKVIGGYDEDYNLI